MKVCIAAVGARTALGLRAVPSAIAAHAGVSRISEHPHMVDNAGDPFMVAMDLTITTGDRSERMFQLARSAIAEVLESFPAYPELTLPVYLGLPEISATYTEQQARSLCNRLAGSFVERAKLRVVPVTEGNAAGLIGLERALQAIEGRISEFVVVAGVDSWMDVDLLEGLDEAARLMSATHKWGFPPGEAGAALLVCKPAAAASLRLPNLGWVASVSINQEPSPMHTDLVCVGTGLGAAMAGAAAAAGASVTKQFCDIDGERYREHEMSYAILRVPSAVFVDAVDYVSPTSQWGHVGAATGPLLTILPLVTHDRGFSPGSWPMVWCGSENGKRGALVLSLGATRKT